MVDIEPHPLQDLKVFSSEFPQRLESLTTPPAITTLFDWQASAPLQSDDSIKKTVRDLLRIGGFKPTGRSKPASEYLIKASQGGFLKAINPAVDICNVVSLHSGLPISVVDLDKVKGKLRIAIAPMGSRYVFNASGQEIDLGGLLCLHDEEGPCANGVKDCQRTKTDGDSTRVLTVMWGTQALPGRSQRAFEWYKQLLEQLGVTPTVLL